MKLSLQFWPRRTKRTFCAGTIQVFKFSLVRPREENILSMWWGPGTDLQRSGAVGISSLTEPQLGFGVHAFPALPQDHVNLYVHQQGDDEGNVEGHDGGVHHKGRVGDDTEGLVTRGCEEEQRVDEYLKCIRWIDLKGMGWAQKWQIVSCTSRTVEPLWTGHQGTRALGTVAAANQSINTDFKR